MLGWLALASSVNSLALSAAAFLPACPKFIPCSLLETIHSIQRRLNPSLRILGILPTMAEMNTIMAQDVLASLQKRFKDIPAFDPVPKSVKFAESNLAGEPIHHYASEQKLVAPYKAIATFITHIPQASQQSR